MTIWKLFLSALTLSILAAAPGAETPAIGIAPSHIAAPTNPLLASPEAWRDAWDGAKLFKIYDVQLLDVKWANPVDPALLAKFSAATGLSVGMEFANGFGRYPNEGYGRAVAQDCLRNMAPVFAAGGKIDSLHLDGAIARTIGDFPSAPNAKWKKSSLSMPDAAREIAEMFTEIRRAHPDIKIGLVPNLMNWNFSPTAPGALGDWSRETKLNYRDILEAIAAALAERGDRIDFIEVDAPYNYYKLKTSPRTKAPIDGAQLLREVEEFCRAHKIAFHLIINCEPRAPFGDFASDATAEELAGGAKVFRQGALDYLAAIKRDKITPDLLMIQSWYCAPAQNLPLGAPNTFTAIVRACRNQK